MIPTPQPIDQLITSGNVTSEAYGIHDMSLIFALLSTHTYSDPILACVREYLTNAVDANKEKEILSHGVAPKRVELHLPNSLSPSLRIRDYGTGLSAEQISAVYRMYACSTKTGNNDTNGMLGIGAKAAFAYTQSWTVVSYHKGECLTYNAVVVNGLPSIQLFHRAFTKEADGMEIIIPVESKDFTAFRDAAKKLVPYFGDTVEAHGLGGVTSRKIKLEGKGWKLREEQEPDVIVMAYVAYPIQYRQLITEPTAEDRAAGVRGLLTLSQVNSLVYSQNGLELHVPTGSVEFASSREELKWTDKTRQTVTIALENFVSAMRDEITAEIAKATTLWEARNTLAGLIKGNSFYSLVSNSDAEYKWNGQTFKHEYYISLPKGDKDPKTGDAPELHRHFSLSRRSSVNLSSSKNHYITLPDKGTVFLVDDVDGKRAQSRIQNHFNNDTTGIERYVLFNDAAAVKKAEANGFAGIKVGKLSDLPVPAPKPRVKGTGVARNKYSCSCFAFKRNVSHRSWGTASHSWDKQTIDYKDGEGVYVVIESFRAPDYNNNQICDILASMELQGIKVPVVTGIKKSFFANKTLGAGWKTFDAWIDEQIAVLASNPKIAKACQEKRDAEVLLSGDYVEGLRKLFNLGLSFPKKSPYTKLMAEYEAIKVDSDEQNHKKLSDLINLLSLARKTMPDTATNTTPCVPLPQRVLEAYPMALLLMQKHVNYLYTPASHVTQAIDAYVRLVDKSSGVY